MYLCIPNKSYNVTDNYNKPYMKVNNSILPLTTNAPSYGGGVIRCKDLNNNTYRVLEYKSTSSSSSDSYYTSAVNSNGLSSTTALTRESTSDTSYATRASTSGTSYLTTGGIGQSYISIISKSGLYNSFQKDYKEYAFSTSMSSQISSVRVNGNYGVMVFMNTASRTGFYNDSYLVTNLITMARRWSYSSRTQDYYTYSISSQYTSSSTVDYLLTTFYDFTSSFKNYVSRNFITNSTYTNISFVFNTSSSNVYQHPHPMYTYGLTIVLTPGSTQTTGTSYLTRSSTSATIYLTRSSTSGYSGVSSSSRSIEISSWL